MKQNKILTFILSAAVLLGGCTKTELTEGGGGKLDPSKTALVELTTISMAGGETSQAAQSRAPGDTYAMPVGSTFRLYAFEKGRTEIGELLASRSYTIETTAGVAVMDGGQDKLYLPLGEVDIYLVGPVSAYVGADLYDIASVNGVTPQRGVDLIASKTAQTINAGQNSLALNALEHKMTKAEIVVATNDKAAYENLVLQKATVTAQAKTATFTFGENGGSITPTTGTDVYTMPAPVDITAAGGLPTWSTTDYLIPQSERQYKIEVEFTSNQRASVDAAAGPTIKYRQSGLITATMQGGTHQRFTAKPLTPVDIIWRLSILPWVDKAEPNVPTGNQDLVFDYRGTDAPITIDGKKYWPDRSGNGNHALLNDMIVYDAAQKCYYSSTGGGRGIEIPDLGADPFMAYTLEATMVSEPSPFSSPFMFRSNASEISLKVHLPYQNNWICYDIGGDASKYRVSATPYPADEDYMRGLATWAFRRAQTPEQSILRNGVQLQDRNPSGSFQNLPFRNNMVLANGSKPSQKLFAMRLYRSRKDDAFLADNAAKDKRTYAGINDATDYVKQGLILDLRGGDAPEDIVYGSRTVKAWKDRSKAGNHAEIVGTGITHDQSNQKYLFANPNGPGNEHSGVLGYLRLISTLGKTQDFTLEFIAKVPAITDKNSLFFFSNHNSDGKDASRIITVHYPWGSKLHFYDPYTLPQQGFAGVAPPTDKYSIVATPQQWCFSRTKDVANLLYENGKLIGTTPGTATLGELGYCLIGAQVSADGSYKVGGFRGEVQAVRFYNRALTEQEMRHNYEIDKQKYNLLP